MTITATIEIYEKSDIEEFEEYAAEINKWSSLWWGDFEEAGIERCYLAFDGDMPVGFQSVNIDGFCVAIEVHPDYQGRGVASALVAESGCYRPEQNECPSFWAAMEARYA